MPLPICQRTVEGLIFSFRVSNYSRLSGNGVPEPPSSAIHYICTYLFIYIFTYNAHSGSILHHYPVALVLAGIRLFH